MISREEGLELLKKYNKEDFHIKHGQTVECIMRYFAKKYNHDVDYWGLVGLLHDIDFEMYPEEHCVKAAKLLKEGGLDDNFIRSVCSHGYVECCDVEPIHEMEKILYAADELTGLIWAGALLRPSKSVQDMETKSVRKKYKDKRFAAGCSREVIARGAEMLGWELDRLFEETLMAMRSCEQ